MAATHRAIFNAVVSGVLYTSKALMEHNPIRGILE